MSVTLKGLAVSWGANGITCTGVTLASPSVVQSSDLSYASKKAELLDANGEPAGLAYYDPNKTITITVVPAHDTTLAGAKTAQDAMIVVPGTIVTLKDTESAIADSTDGVAGTPYLLTESRLRRVNTGASVIEMDLLAYGTDVTTTVT